MNIEVLRPENTSYLEQYKILGFRSKDDMVEEALEMLRQKLTRFPHLSGWQLQRIENAKKDIDEGNYLTNSQADKIVDEWLKR
jgi:anti-sigma28 factor (negative regulator of flagellin synthesis)